MLKEIGTKLEMITIMTRHDHYFVKSFGDHRINNFWHCPRCSKTFKEVKKLPPYGLYYVHHDDKKIYLEEIGY